MKDEIVTIEGTDIRSSDIVMVSNVEKARRITNKPLWPWIAGKKTAMYGFTITFTSGKTTEFNDFQTANDAIAAKEKVRNAIIGWKPYYASHSNGARPIRQNN